MGAAPLERLLIDRVLTGWLHLHYAEALYVQRNGALTPAACEYHQRTIGRAQRRYLAAVKALAQVRRLRVPAVQVNIGEKQVNIA